MTSDLREELSALAETQTFSPDPSAWDRGRRVRRRARVVRGAAVLAVVAVIVGAGVLAVRPDSVGPAGNIVPDGAIPSVIETPAASLPFETDFAIGRASVAFSDNVLTVIGASDGSYHHFAEDADVVALSPDGTRLAWWGSKGPAPGRIAIADLMSGEVQQFAHNSGRGATVTALQWRPDSVQLLWNGRGDEGAAAGLIDVTGPSESPDIAGRFGARGLISPGSGVIALPSKGEVMSSPFLVQRPDGLQGMRLDRPLPTDLHPDGALVRPLGWAEEDLVVAVVDPPQSDDVERPRLAIFTSPDQPQSEWVYREFLPRLPPVESLSIAVDLIPDLTGDPGQELTHDFGAGPAGQRDISWMIGLGVAAAVAVLMGLRWLWRWLLRRSLG